MNGQENPIPNLFTFLRWADIYGAESTLDEVQAGLAEFDRELLVQNLLKFNFLIAGPDAALDIELQRGILESAISEQLHNDIHDAFQRGITADVILNAHQLLYALKVSLRSGPETGGLGLANPTDRPRLGELLLQVNDHVNLLHEEDDGASDIESKLGLLTTMLPIFDFLNPPNVYEATARLSRMLGIIDADLAEARADEHVDIPGIFEGVAGISVDAYMAFTYGLWAYMETLGQDDVRADAGVTMVVPDAFVAHMEASAEEFRAYLRLVSKSDDEFRDALSVDRGIPDLLDFVTFRDYPVIEFPEDRYRCIHRPFLEDKVTQGVFWLPHRQVSFDGQRFRGWWGQLYEEYVHRLMREFYPPNALRYFPNPTCSNGDELADGILDYGDSIVFFEFKSSLLSMSARHPATPEDLGTELQSKLGTAQLGRAVSRFLSADGDHNCVIDGLDVARVSTVYPVLVCLDHAMGSYLLGATAEHFFREALDLPDDAPEVKPLTVLTVEELEHLLPYVDDHSFVQLLEVWFEADPTAITSFGFVMKQLVYGTTLRENRWVVEEAEAWQQRVRGYLFPSAAAQNAGNSHAYQDPQQKSAGSD